MGKCIHGFKYQDECARCLAKEDPPKEEMKLEAEEDAD
jgi:hypothetical protein